MAKKHRVKRITLVANLRKVAVEKERKYKEAKEKGAAKKQARENNCAPTTQVASHLKKKGATQQKISSEHIEDEDADAPQQKKQKSPAA